ncbi:MAG: tyrosine-type recombinase/integrase [Akkermansiaceae bacterium]
MQPDSTHAGSTTAKHKKSKKSLVAIRGFPGLCKRGDRYYARANNRAESLRTKDFETAKRRLRPTRDRLRAAAKSNGELPTVRQALHRALEAIQNDPEKSDSYREKTAPRYLQQILATCSFLDLPISKVSRKQFQAWLNICLKNYSPTTANGCLSALWSRAWTEAEEEGWISTRPQVRFRRAKAQARYLERKRKENPDAETDLIDILPTLGQFDDLVNSIRIQGKVDSLTSALAVEFLAATGLRNPSESLLIRWKDIDFDSRDGKGTIRVTRVKGGYCRETLPLTGPARDALLRIREAGLARRGDKRKDVVLVGKNGLQPTDRVLVINSPGRALGNACKREGIPHLRVHDLRHLFCTRALQVTWDVKSLAHYVGHKDGGVLICQRYSHWCPEHANNLAELF